MNGAENELKKFMIGTVMLLAISQTVNLSQSFAFGTTEAEVAADHLNVRSMDSMSAPAIGTVRKGERLSILSERNGWAQIDFHGKTGWVSAVYLSKRESAPDNKQASFATVTGGDVRIRKTPDLHSAVLGTIEEREKVNVLKTKSDWWYVRTKNGAEGWVSAQYLKPKEAGISDVLPNRTWNGNEAVKNGIKGKRIVLDPGHGGGDTGAKGANHSSLESVLTLRTALLAAEKLRAAGAIVVMTRMSDQYFSLANRVFQSESVFADAFISIHYNSSLKPHARGLSTFYNKPFDKELAQSIQDSILDHRTNLEDRGVQFGDYYVIRENQRPAVLVELGFLSNQHDEFQAETDIFQENAANGLADGLKVYFDSN